MLKAGAGPVEDRGRVLLARFSLVVGREIIGGNGGRPQGNSERLRVVVEK